MKRMIIALFVMIVSIVPVSVYGSVYCSGKVTKFYIGCTSEVVITPAIKQMNHAA